MPYRVTATRALKAGEELTVDYRTLSWRGLGGQQQQQQQQQQQEDGDGAPSPTPHRRRSPAPAVGTPGFRCDCCGRGVFR
jgi:hypothetical protein